MTVKKSKKGLIIPIVVFILGLAIALYPVISRLYYEREAGNQVLGFEAAKAEIEDAEVTRRINLAKAYNQTLDPSKIGDPYTAEEEQGVAEYARMLELREKNGHVEIPKLGQDLPIYAGTSNQVLEKGAGHLEGTSIPIGGESTHAVITAHRGLPTAKLFSDLDKMEIGDKFYVHNIQTVLAYQVDQILIVEPSDFEPVLVVEGEDYITLFSCTPYMVNSHRLLVRGERIDYVPAVVEQEIATRRQSNTYQMLFYVTLALLAFVLLAVAYLKFRKKKKIDDN